MRLLPRSLRGRCYLACIVLAVLALGAGATGLVVVRLVREADARGRQVSTQAHEIAEALLSLRLTGFQLVGSKDPKQLEMVRARFAEEVTAIAARSTTYGLDAAQLVEAGSKIIRLMEKFDVRGSLQILYGPANDAHTMMLAEVQRISEDRLAMVDQETRQVQRIGMLVVGSGSLVMLLVLAVLGWSARRVIAIRLEALGKTMADVEAGNLASVVAVSGEDEIASLATNLRSMLEQQRKAVETIRSESVSLAAEAGSMSAIATQLNSAAHSTADRAKGAADDMTHISTYVGQAASAADELNLAIAEVAQAAEQATVSSRAASAQATTVRSSIARLSEIGDQVGMIAEQISGITKQVNLLALNATIEAARAGDAGRGFAVVASEVKGLSRRTASATDDIAKAAGQVGADSRAAVGSVEAVLTAVGGIAQEQQTASAAIEEQRATVGAIATAMRSAVSSGKTAHLAVDAVASEAIETCHAATQAQHAAQNLSSLADRLRSSVARFRT